MIQKTYLAVRAELGDKALKHQARQHDGVTDDVKGISDTGTELNIQTLDDAQSVGGVDGGPDRITGQCDLNGGQRGFGIADFTDHHGVSIISVGARDRIGIGVASLISLFGVDGDLVHPPDRLLRGVFDGQKVVPRTFFDQRFHAVCQRRRFTGAGRPGDKDDTSSGRKRPKKPGLGLGKSFGSRLVNNLYRLVRISQLGQSLFQTAGSTRRVMQQA